MSKKEASAAAAACWKAAKAAGASGCGGCTGRARAKARANRDAMSFLTLGEPPTTRGTTDRA